MSDKWLLAAGVVVLLISAVLNMNDISAGVWVNLLAWMMMAVAGLSMVLHHGK